MLRANLWTDVGLVNGGAGKVADLVYEKGKNPHMPCQLF
jgi:hypothetical protein